MAHMVGTSAAIDGIMAPSMKPLEAKLKNVLVAGKVSPEKTALQKEIGCVGQVVFEKEKSMSIKALCASWNESQ